MKLRWKIAQAAELKWWKNYLKNKPEKEYLEWKKGYWKDFLRQIADVVKLQKGEHVLDAGCGPAGIFMALQEQRTDAVDPLLEEYSNNLPHFIKANYPWVNFYASALETFEPPRQYDKVFCLNAINHVSDLNKGFDKIVNATKSGGFLIVSTDAHKYDLLKRLFQLIPGDVLHPHQYNVQEYEQMLTGRGCEIVRKLKNKSGNIFDYWVFVARKL